MDGSSVMLTANGFLVMVRQRRISSRRAAGVVKMRAVMMPRPPALDTAAARSAVPMCIMPPWTTGTVGERERHRVRTQCSSLCVFFWHVLTADAETASEFCCKRHCECVCMSDEEENDCEE